MGRRNNPVQVLKTDLVFYQQDYVVRVGLSRILLTHRVIDFNNLCNVLFRGKGLEHFEEYLCQNTSIIISAVMMLLLHTQMLGKKIQLMLFQLRVHGSTHHKGVDLNRVLFPAAALDCRTQKTHIKISIMSDKNIAAITKTEELFQCLLLERGICHHLIGNAGKTGNLQRNRFLRIYEYVKGLRYNTFFNLYRPYFNNTLSCSRKTCGFQIEYNIGAINICICFTLDGWQHIIDKISLNTIDCLKVRVFCAYFLNCFHYLWECLYNTMVCDCNCWVSPIMGTADKLFCGRHRVHGRHGGVQVQLNTFDRRIISNNIFYNGIDIARAHNHVTVIFIVGNIALHQNGITDLQSIQLRFIFNFVKDLKIDGTGVVCDGNAHNKVVFIPRDAAFHRENITPNNSRAAVHSQSRNRDRRTLNKPIASDWLFGCFNIRNVRFFFLINMFFGNRIRCCRIQHLLLRRHRCFFPWRCLLRDWQSFGNNLFCCKRNRLLHGLQFIIRHRNKAYLRANSKQSFGLCSNFCGK